MDVLIMGLKQLYPRATPNVAADLDIPVVGLKPAGDGRDNARRREVWMYLSGFETADRKS